MSDIQLNDEPETYPDSFIDWITSLDTKEVIRSMWLKMSIEERKEFVEQDDKHNCDKCGAVCTENNWFICGNCCECYCIPCDEKLNPKGTGVCNICDDPEKLYTTENSQ